MYWVENIYLYAYEIFRAHDDFEDWRAKISLPFDRIINFYRLYELFLIPWIQNRKKYYGPIKFQIEKSLIIAKCWMK